jgi:cytochrome c oxidase subunit II
MRRAAAVLALAASIGCSTRPATLDPAGPQAAAIAELALGFAAVCAIVYALVLVALAAAVFRRRPPQPHRTLPNDGAHLPPIVLEPEPLGERRFARVVAVATAVTLVLLVLLLAASAWTGRTIFTTGSATPLQIQITGKQWWWEVVYPGAAPNEQITTANELHVPVGRTILVELRADDVIHSFWVPRLHGKRDLIPGRANSIAFRVDVPGRYEGRCAEFCGHQHAHMAIIVVAESADAFEAWRRAQLAPARAPVDPEIRRGSEVFATAPCALCHAIRGSGAGGRFGPDLTHLASRDRIGAGVLPNDAGGLAAWIVDTQGVKPGCRMPANAVAGADVAPLVAYLRSLE